MATRREILRKLDDLEPKIARAFREAVQSIKSRAQLNELARIIDELQGGAIVPPSVVAQAVRAAGVREGGMSELTEAVRAAYREGGEFTAGEAPARLGFTFNINNPRAENWIRERSSTLVTNIEEEQREAIRKTLEAGMQRGQGPRRTALDIVGRLDRRTGKRVGGIIGVTSGQAEAANNARDILSDPDQIRHYFVKGRNTGRMKPRFKLTDRRFDSLVKRAIEEGRALPQGDIDRIVTNYTSRLEMLRGTTVGRTESLTTFNAARDESLQQAVDQGLARSENIQRVWDATADGRTRTDHMIADGQTVGMNEDFMVGGFPMRHPGDPNAPARQVINCRCFTVQRVDWIAEEQAA